LLVTVSGFAFGRAYHHRTKFETLNFNNMENVNLKNETPADAKPVLAAVNPFIANTAKDYDMSYESVEVYYNRYGSTPMFYEKLEEHLKQRSF
jgi:hypothetical protein